jgi:hypothetical protein
MIIKLRRTAPFASLIWHQLYKPAPGKTRISRPGLWPCSVHVAAGTNLWPGKYSSGREREIFTMKSAEVLEHIRIGFPSIGSGDELHLGNGGLFRVLRKEGETAIFKISKGTVGYPSNSQRGRFERQRYGHARQGALVKTPQRSIIRSCQILFTIAIPHKLSDWSWSIQHGGMAQRRNGVLAKHSQVSCWLWQDGCLSLLAFWRPQFYRAR